MFEKESGDKSPHSKAIECGCFRIVFDWRGDRFGHRLERRIDRQWRAAVASVEGSPDVDWPPSPALQSLQIEDREDGKVALLVGQASKNHWSASVQAELSRRRIVFDVACRVCQPPQWLGSQYRAVGDMSLPIDFEALPHESLVEDSSGGKPSQWWIRPADFPADLPHTVRWRYAIVLAG